jgi:tRNA(Ile)-lysidine synthase
MIDAFSAYLTASELLPAGSRVVVGCSGGADSMALTDLLRRLNYDMVLVHVNHKLRGADADADEQLVRDYAEAHALKLTVFDASEHLMGRKDDGLQAAARRLRYERFEEVRQQHNGSHIATAHHRDDLVETYLAHILRGSHWRGFSSIPRVNGNVVRPLLHVSRDELLRYITEFEVPYREDASNKSPVYQRNRIRHELIPLMESIRPGFRRNILRQIELFIETNAVLEGFLGKLATDVILLRPEGLYIAAEGIDELPFMRLLLLQVTADYGFHAARVDEVVELLHSAPGKQLLSSSHRIVRERQHLVIAPLPDETGEPLLLERHTEEVHHPVRLVIDHIEGDAIAYTADADEAVFDADALTWPLTLRRWQAGDRIAPIGLEGSMKVSDLLTQAKLGTLEKEQVYVLESGGALIWVIGFRMAEHAKVTANTRKALRFVRLAPDAV